MTGGSSRLRSARHWPPPGSFGTMFSKRACCARRAQGLRPVRLSWFDVLIFLSSALRDTGAAHVELPNLHVACSTHRLAAAWLTGAPTPLTPSRHVAREFRSGRA